LKEELKEIEEENNKRTLAGSVTTPGSMDTETALE